MSKNRDIYFIKEEECIELPVLRFYVYCMTERKKIEVRFNRLEQKTTEKNGKMLYNISKARFLQ